MQITIFTRSHSQSLHCECNSPQLIQRSATGQLLVHRPMDEEGAADEDVTFARGPPFFLLLCLILPLSRSRWRWLKPCRRRRPLSEPIFLLGRLRLLAAAGLLALVLVLVRLPLVSFLLSFFFFLLLRCSRFFLFAVLRLQCPRHPEHGSPRSYGVPNRSGKLPL